MIFALKITKRNRMNIMKWNYGVKIPKACVTDGDYLITWTNEHLANLIRSEKDLRADFEFVNAELPNEFSEVRER